MNIFRVLTSIIYVINIWTNVTAQVFQYFLVDNKKQTAAVLDTVKLPTCTHIDLKQNVTLRGGINSGNFTKLGEVADMRTCIDACCQDIKCDVAFMAHTTCYSLKCHDEKLCETVPSKPRKSGKIIQISHIVRGGGKGDDIDTFSQQQGIGKYANMEKAVCRPSKHVENATLRGGKYAGSMVRLDVSNIYECVEKCCNRNDCDLIYWWKKRCHAVSCYTDELCKSSESEDNEEHVLVYINMRNKERKTDKATTCTAGCSDGMCVADNKCACDVGYQGKHCEKLATKGYCGETDCGKNGRCNTNDTCICKTGYFGYLCEKTLECHPKCFRGVCMNNSTENFKCRCDIGWEGKYCNKTNGDILISSEDGDEVLFTGLKERENDLRRPEDGRSDSISSVSVAIGCALAAAILGAAAIAFVTRTILRRHSNNVNYEILREPLRQNTKKHLYSS